MQFNDKLETRARGKWSQSSTLLGERRRPTERPPVVGEEIHLTFRASLLLKVLRCAAQKIVVANRPV